MKNQKYLLLFLVILLLVLPFQAVNHSHSSIDNKDECPDCHWIQIFFTLFIFFVFLFKSVFLLKPLFIEDLVVPQLIFYHFYSIRGPPEH